MLFLSGWNFSVLPLWRNSLWFPAFIDWLRPPAPEVSRLLIGQSHLYPFDGLGVSNV